MPGIRIQPTGRRGLKTLEKSKINSKYITRHIPLAILQNIAQNKEKKNINSGQSLACKKNVNRISPNFVRAGGLKLIRLYQKFARLLPPNCRFSPSCSEYTYLAIEKYGLIKGIFLGLKRIFCCHPFHPGGYDPLR